MIKRLVCLLSLILLCAGTALAQNQPKSDLFLGYTYDRLSPDTPGVGGINLHGGSASISWNAHRHVGLVADFGGYHGTKTIPLAGQPGTSTLSGEIYTYMFGPRFTYRNSENSQSVTPFAQVLFGGAHASAEILGSTSSMNSFAMSAGGGFDVKIVDRVSWRMAQAEYLLTRFDEIGLGRVNQHNFRFSTGIVFHF